MNTQSRKPLGFRWILFVLLAISPFACSDEANCVDLCEEAQQGDCTSIKGDCGAFCDAALNVEEPSGCADQREDYQDCLNSGDTCENDCGSEETSWSGCLTSYCLANSDNADCQTLAASF